MEIVSRSYCALVAHLPIFRSRCSCFLLASALAANHGSDGGVDDVADDVIDERIRHDSGVLCVRVCVL